MPSEFICNIEVDLAIPDFTDASVPLGQIAKKVADDSQKNIRQQTNLDGSRYQPLSKKTVQAKIREGAENPQRALYRKGVMYRAIHIYKTGKNSFAVGIIPRGSPRRDLVGMIHQEIGPVIRSFLGFSQSTYTWARARMERWLVEKTQKSARKYINFKY